MATDIPFTQNVRDLSNQQGYQFEFVCDRCGNGYRSPYQANVKENVKEKGRGLLRVASSLMGDRSETMRDLGNAANQMTFNQSTNSAQKDSALAKAGEHVRDNFKQCRGCGKWVCIPVCWNNEVGQCLTCSPSVGDEMSKAQASAQVDQIREKAKSTDWTAGLDMTDRALVECPHCHARVKGGKFCPECGQAFATKHTCPSCGAEEDGDMKFCPECGTKF
jgi:hypothetical protein